MSSARLDLVGVVVEHMARSLAFYRRLGLDIPAEADSQPHAELPLRGGVRLAWDTIETVRSFDPAFTLSGGSGIGLAFLVDAPADVDATYERLVSAGYDGHKPPWDAFWGQRYASIHDPDGHTVDLFAPLEGGGS